MVKVNKPNNFKNIIEAIKEVCGIEYGFPSNHKGIIDALAMCPGGGLGGDINKLLAGKGIQLNPSHGDLSLSDITISAGGSDFPFCDDCFVWCEPSNDIDIYSVKADGPTSVIKFSSESCGACIRMSHYDSKVAKELGHEFVTATTDCKEWDQYQYLLEAVYPNPDKIGFPTYIVAQGNDSDNMQVLGAIRGGLEKSKFRQRLASIEVGTPMEIPTVGTTASGGGDKKSHCTNFNQTGGCKPFRFDCWAEKARICEGDNFKLDLEVKTHGCNSCLDSNPPGGSELSYEWYSSKNKDGPWKFVSNRQLITIKPGKEYKAGDVVWFQARATCKDYPGGSITIRGGGGKSPEEGGNGLQPVKVTVVKCSDPNEPPDPEDFCATKDCPAGKFCCEGSESCEECCKNSHCPKGETCKDGKCVGPDTNPPECTQDKDCPGDEICKDGVCEDPADEPECSKDKDCPGDQICKDGVCEDPPAPNPDPNPDPDPNPPECTQDKDCPGDEICEDGVCVDPPTPPDPGECTQDKDCPGDEICEDGVCVDPPPSCTEDDDCPSGEICKDGECIDKPPVDPPTDPCDGVTCPPGEVCKDGECVKQICLDNNCNGGWVVDWDCVKTKMGL